MKRILLFSKPTTFGAKGNCALSSTITSRKAYIKAASSATITITGGEYSPDGGVTWTATSGTRGTFPYLLVRGTSSANYLGKGVDLGVVTVTLTVDGKTYTFVISTSRELYGVDLDGKNVYVPDIGAYEY